MGCLGWFICEFKQGSGRGDALGGSAWWQSCRVEISYDHDGGSAIGQKLDTLDLNLDIASCQVGTLCEQRTPADTVHGTMDT